MSSTLPALLRFADFEVDLRAGRLHQQGARIRLQEQPFRVLTALLEAGGQVVTREELRHRLWPADTFVDFDHRLAAAISKLRDALHDSAESPRFIETVGRRGYRFMLPLEPVGVAVSPAAPAPQISHPQTAQEAAPEAVPSRPVAPQRIRSRVALRIVAFALPALFTFAFLYRWRESGTTAAGSPRISSVAVLPLENLSNDPEQEYFVEGMTDEIITDLAKLPGIRVISRTSTVQYKGTHKTMPQIARELNVDAVLEGTVLRSGDRVRVRTQLIYAPADRHIWAEAYERDLKDVLALQANLAQDIATEIRINLTSQQQAKLAAPRAVDPEAHELYLKGRYFWNKRDEAGFVKAADYFQQAIAKDPGYAAPYAGLADTYALSHAFPSVRPEELLPKAQASAEKALQLDPNLAEAHASLGLLAPFIDWNWAGAKNHYERAIELNPNYATAHHWYAEGYLVPIGEIDKAIAEMRKAQELDPLSAVITTDLGKGLYFARRYDDAVVQFTRALELDPNFGSAHNWMSDTFLEQGKYPEAAAELEKTIPFRDERVHWRQIAYLDARMGHRAEARAALAKSLQLSRGQPVHSGALALTYAALGDKEQAFSWLEKAYAEKSAFLTSVKYWTVFDPLRADPRYADLLRRIGLPQETQTVSR